MNKDIRNYNDKGQWHGYIEWYHPKDDEFWYRALYYYEDRIMRGTVPEEAGFSVRCVKDN